MPFFLIFKGYKMHYFRVSKIKACCNLYPSPIPTVHLWVVLDDEEHNWMFQHCHGEGALGLILPVSVNFQVLQRRCPRL